jgi:rubrerythrin
MTIQRWRKGVDGEDELWVCWTCDAHLHVDSVGSACPVCGESADEEGPAGRAALREKEGE